MYIILLIILINAAGLLLKYYDLDRFVIFFGFRFHLSLTLPFLYLVVQKEFTFIKHELKKFSLRNFFAHFILIIIPLFILVVVLYVLKYAELGDPNYFYEFGVSSMADLPVYFIWNLPQLLMAALFFRFVTSARKINFILGFILILSLFIYEIIPLKKEKFLLLALFDWISVSVLFSLIMMKSKSIYSFAVSVFIFLWSSILLFGSENESIIKNLFAKNYSSWDGFVELSKQITNYNFIIQVLITIIFFLIYYIVSQRKIKS